MIKSRNCLPELRFPEFVSEGEWMECELGELCDYWNGASYENGVNENGEYDLISLNSMDIEGNLKTEMKRVLYSDNSLKKNDLVMVLSDVAHGDFLGLTDIIPNEKYVLNQRMAGLRVKDIEQTIPFFLRVYINNNQPYFKTMGQGSSQLNLSKSSVTKFPVKIPESLNEQRKIASCLSSLDEIIASHSQKLELLIEYKKGLMQNLFPQEGKRVPKYRFKEFVNDEVWNLKEFSNYIKLYRGSSPRPIQDYLTQDENGVNWIKIGDAKNAIDSIIYTVEEKITRKGAAKSRKVEIGELILANSMSYGKTYELAIDGCIYDGWFVLREFERYFYKPFLLQLLNSEYVQKQYQRLSAGGVVQNISSEVVYKTMLFHTSLKEQQKIASCLAVSDKLIATQTEKIEQLKLHKKGLMQALFPKIND